MNTCDKTLFELEAQFLAWQQREAEAGRSTTATVGYYRRELARFTRAPDPNHEGHALGELLLDQLRPIHLETTKTSWHSVQAVQRLFNWSAKLGVFGPSPFNGVERPRLGERERVLSRPELVRALRKSRRQFRLFLEGMRGSLARPQEIRALRWGMLLPDLTGAVLTQFKAKARRKDGCRVRHLFFDARLRRLLARLKEREPTGPHDPVFRNSKGRPWSSNAVRLVMKRLRARAGLADQGEPVVAYTMRHTAATTATANGLRDKLLAELLGHADVRTTARYQHLQAPHLAAVIDQATRRPAA